MDELAGFIVLGGPLFPMLVWLVISIVLTVVIVHPKGNFVRRAGIRLLVIVVLVVLPFVDEIAGRVYFNHLCKTQAGSKVYQTVELPAEYWDEDGNPKIFNEWGYLKRDFWLKRLDESGGSVERYSSIFNIDKNISTIVYKNRDVLLGEITTFRYWGGWVRQNFSPNNTADSCQFINSPSFSREFYSKFFKPPYMLEKGDN